MKFNSILLTGLCVFMAMPVMMMDTCEATDNAPDGMVTESFTVIDDEGNVEIIYADDIDGEFIEPEAEVYDAIGGDPNVTCGVVYINTNDVTEYKHAYTGATGYITGSYAVDAAYIGYYNDKVRAKIAGVVADFDPEDVKVVGYNGDCDVSYYKQEMGYLKHYYYYGSTHAIASTRVGFSQSYLNDGEAYYSYDGHYFYSTYQDMTLDYQENTTYRAVNSDSPYYNYYQYVSHRSTSSLSGDELDQIAIDAIGWDEYTNSALYNLGNSFVENQNNYYVNAMCMYGVAANESNWGRSYIAKERNNLFGHGAVDNNPYYGSNGYDSPSYSVKYHAYNFASRGYLDYGDWRYFGGCLGDKAVGFNVKYASDPYWGEKAACRVFFMDETPDDYRSEVIAIIKGDKIGIELYNTPNGSIIRCPDEQPLSEIWVSDMPINVLGREVVNGVNWLKIRSDSSLNEARTAVDYAAIYDKTRDYLYIRESEVQFVIGSIEGSVSVDIPEQEQQPANSEVPEMNLGKTYNYKENMVVFLPNTKVSDIPDALCDTDKLKTGSIVTVKQNTYTAVVYGDANGDGNVNSGDLLVIVKYLQGKYTLKNLESADVNHDGKINSGDLLAIVKYLQGKYTINLG